MLEGLLVATENLTKYSISSLPGWDWGSNAYLSEEDQSELFLEGNDNESSFYAGDSDFDSPNFAHVSKGRRRMPSTDKVR